MWLIPKYEIRLISKFERLATSEGKSESFLSVKCGSCSKLWHAYSQTWDMAHYQRWDMNPFQSCTKKNMIMSWRFIVGHSRGWNWEHPDTGWSVYLPPFYSPHPTPPHPQAYPLHYNIPFAVSFTLLCFIAVLRNTYLTSEAAQKLILDTPYY